MVDQSLGANSFELAKFWHFDDGVFNVGIEGGCHNGHNRKIKCWKVSKANKARKPSICEKNILGATYCDPSLVTNRPTW